MGSLCKAAQVFLFIDIVTYRLDPDNSPFVCVKGREWCSLFLGRYD